MLKESSRSIVHSRIHSKRQDIFADPSDTAACDEARELIARMTGRILMNPPENLYDSMVEEADRIFREREEEMNRQKQEGQEQYGKITAGIQETQAHKDMVRIFQSFRMEDLKGFLRRNPGFFDGFSVEELDLLIASRRILARRSKHKKERKFSEEVILLVGEEKKKRG